MRIEIFGDEMHKFVNKKEGLIILFSKEELLKLRAAKKMFDALNVQIENVDNWLGTGAPATSEESERIYKQLKDSVNFAKQVFDDDFLNLKQFEADNWLEDFLDEGHSVEDASLYLCNKAAKGEDITCESRSLMLFLDDIERRF